MSIKIPRSFLITLLLVVWSQLSITVTNANGNGSDSIHGQDFTILLRNKEFEYIGSKNNVKTLLPGLEPLLNEAFVNEPGRILQLTEEEIAISFNHYLGFCLDLEGAILHVISERGIDLEKEIFIVDLYRPYKDQDDIMDVTLSRHSKVNVSNHRRFYIIFGKRFSNLQPSDEDELTQRVTELIKEKLIEILDT